MHWRSLAIPIFMPAVIMSVVLLPGTISCDKSDPAASTPTASTPTTAPTTRATFARLPVVFMIDKQAIECPAAVLASVSADAPESLMLHSDDPPEAAREGYHGNSFYFDFKVPDLDRDVVLGTVVRLKPAAVEHDDVADGIMIDGQRLILSPVDATISFEPAGDHMMAKLSGVFQLTDSDKPALVPATLNVTARMAVEYPR